MAANRHSAPPTPAAAAPGHPAHDDQDFQKGAVESDQPADRPQAGNPNAPALNDQGLPADPVAIAQDAIGASEDGSQGRPGRPGRPGGPGKPGRAIAGAPLRAHGGAFAPRKSPYPAYQAYPAYLP